MKNEKDDIRSRVTKRMIKESVKKLLETKLLKSIFVAEICKTAQINRGTFYNHYYDIYDVYEQIENEFFEEISGRLKSIDISNLNYAFIKEIMDFILQNLNFTKIMLENVGESTFMKRVIDMLKEKYIGEYTERYPKLPKQTVQTLFTYTMNGSVGIIVEWLYGEKNPTTELISRQITELNRTVMMGILKL